MVEEREGVEDVRAGCCGVGGEGEEGNKGGGGGTGAAATRRVVNTRVGSVTPGEGRGFDPEGGRFCFEQKSFCLVSDFCWIRTQARTTA